MPSVPQLSILAAAALLALPVAATAQADPSRPITLGDAARLAAARGAAAVAAREQAVQSGARAMQRRADLLPSVTSDALVDGGSEDTVSPGSGIPGGFWTPVSERTLDARIRITQRLIDLPAVKRYQAATADAFAAGQRASVSAEDAATRGAMGYLRVQSAQGTLAARLADSALAAELLDIARQQLAAGTAIALDVTRAESQLASTVSQLITVRSEYARAGLALLHLLALPLDTRLELADSLREPDARDIEISEPDAIRAALIRRPEILAAGADADAARRGIAAVKAERMPTVALFGQAASTSEGMYDQRSFGVSVSVPLFDGFKREARVAEERAREREASVRQADARLQAEVEVRSAMLGLAAARERVGAAQVQLRLAEQEVAQARERFKAGIAGNADVIQASLTLNGARDLVVGALTAYHAARVELARAQGTTTSLP